jgi:hypothetical protein
MCNDGSATNPGADRRGGNPRRVLELRNEFLKARVEKFEVAEQPRRGLRAVGGE